MSMDNVRNAVKVPMSYGGGVTLLWEIFPVFFFRFSFFLPRVACADLLNGSIKFVAEGVFYFLSFTV